MASTSRKLDLLGDCILRRDHEGHLFLMNRQERGWNSSSIRVDSEEDLLDRFNVTLGEWTKDEHSPYAPILCVKTAVQSPSQAQLSGTR